jgi:hypothetical protein
MAEIGVRWDHHDAPPDREDWERIIQDALADTPAVAGTVVMKHDGDLWEVEVARVGQIPVGTEPSLPDPTDFQLQVERALLAAGKPVRPRAVPATAAP